MPSVSVAAMNTSSDHGTDFSALPRSTDPHRGLAASSAPSRPTIAGCSPCSGSEHHSTTTTATSMAERVCAVVRGPEMGEAECACMSFRLIETGSRRSSRRVNSRRISSVHTCEDTTASGRPRISHVATPKLRCPAASRIWAVIRCAPAPR